MTEFSLIIPTYNEAENIKTLIPRLIALLVPTGKTFEIIVVDDDSKDLTWKVTQDTFANDSRVKVLRRINKKGLSSAVLDGMAMASGKYMGVMDADLQHDENIIPKMLEEIKTHDIVVGSRVVGDGGYGEWGFVRKMMSKTATLAAKIMLPISVGDPMSGYFLVTREHYNNLVSEINPRGFKILLEFLARKKGIKSKEVGYVFKTRVHGETKMSSSVIQNYLVALYDIRFGKYISITFLKYIVTGLIGVFVNLFGQFLANNLFSLKDSLYITNFTLPSIGVLIGFILSIINNYIINNIWTFKSSQITGFQNHMKGFSKFILVSLVGLIIQLSVWRFSYQFIQTSFPDLLFDGLTYLCNFVGIMFATATNYFMNKNFTWEQNEG